MRPDVEEFFCGISFDAYRLLGSHPAGPGRGLAVYPVGGRMPAGVQLLGTGTGWDLYSAAEAPPFVRTACGAGGYPGAAGSCTSITFRAGRQLAAAGRPVCLCV